MQINSDRTQPVSVQTRMAAWVDSPQPGVRRLLLAREGDEVAQATSLVHFAPGSHFPEHEHGGGEEILVLEGIFSDETGDYPQGSYLRNPPGSVHRPFSVEGCVILVKLWQFAPDDQAQVFCPTAQGLWERQDSGLERQHLHQHGGTDTALYRCAAGATWTEHYPGGLELFVLEGSLSDGKDRYGAGCWLRWPKGYQARWQAEQNSRFYCQTGHLEQYSCWDVLNANKC